MTSLKSVPYERFITSNRDTRQSIAPKSERKKRTKIVSNKRLKLAPRTERTKTSSNKLLRPVLIIGRATSNIIKYPKTKPDKEIVTFTLSPETNYKVATNEKRYVVPKHSPELMKFRKYELGKLQPKIDVTPKVFGDSVAVKREKSRLTREYKKQIADQNRPNYEKMLADREYQTSMKKLGRTDVVENKYQAYKKNWQKAKTPLQYTAAGLGGFGMKAFEVGRNIGEFAVASPMREIKQDKKKGTYNPLISGIVPGYYHTRGIYDWTDKRKDDKWHTPVNWRAVEGGVDVALIGASAIAKPTTIVGKQTIKHGGKYFAKQAGKTAIKAGVPALIIGPEIAQVVRGEETVKGAMFDIIGTGAKILTVGSMMSTVASHPIQKSYYDRMIKQHTRPMTYKQLKSDLVKQYKSAGIKHPTKRANEILKSTTIIQGPVNVKYKPRISKITDPKIKSLKPKFTKIAGTDTVSLTSKGKEVGNVGYEVGKDGINIFYLQGKNPQASTKLIKTLAQKYPTKTIIASPSINQQLYTGIGFKKSQSSNLFTLAPAKKIVTKQIIPQKNILGAYRLQKLDASSVMTPEKQAMQLQRQGKFYYHSNLDYIQPSKAAVVRANKAGLSKPKVAGQFSSEYGYPFVKTHKPTVNILGEYVGPRRQKIISHELGHYFDRTFMSPKTSVAWADNYRRGEAMANALGVVKTPLASSWFGGTGTKAVLPIAIPASVKSTQEVLKNKI